MKKITLVKYLAIVLLAGYVANSAAYADEVSSDQTTTDTQQQNANTGATSGSTDSQSTTTNGQGASQDSTDGPLAKYLTRPSL